ncbi:MAG: hypothetical protein ACREA3_06680 [Nitrosotalea sp.]
MARKGSHQRPHTRHSKFGTPFRAGLGKYRSAGITREQLYNSTAKVRIPTFRDPRFPIRTIRPSTIAKVKNIGQQVSWNAFLDGVFVTASFATGQPWIYPAFRAYQLGNFAYKMAKKLEERQTDKPIEELAKKGLDIGVQQISDPKVNEISNKILYAFCQTGLASMVVRETALDRNIVDTMFQSTVSNVLQNGIENLVNFTVAIA